MIKTKILSTALNNILFRQLKEEGERALYRSLCILTQYTHIQKSNVNRDSLETHWPSQHAHILSQRKKEQKASIKYI